MATGWNAVCDVLGVASGTVWSFDHTCGGNYWLATTLDDGRLLAVSWPDDSFGANDVPAMATERGGFGWGVYTVDADGHCDDLPEDWGSCDVEALPLVVRSLAVAS